MTTAIPGTVEPAMARREPRRRRVMSSPGRSGAWAFLALLLFGTLFPFFWMVREAFTHNADIFNDFGWWPKNPTVVNFLRVLGFATPAQVQAEAPQSLQTLNVFLGLRNSILFTIAVSIGSVFFSSGAAYAFARLHWPGRDTVFHIFLAGLMMPPIFATLPNFVTIRDLGWIDQWSGLLAPYLLFSPFAVFFLRQFYLNIPLELEEAAQLDGLSKWGIYWRIVVPTSVAPLATMLTIQAVYAWNEYLWPLLVTKTSDTQLLTAQLGSFVRNSPTTAPDWSGFMAATTVTVVPLVVFVLLFGKRLVSNIQFASGGK